MHPTPSNVPVYNAPPQPLRIQLMPNNTEYSRRLTFVSYSPACEYINYCPLLHINMLARARILVMFLHCMLQSSVAPLGRWFFLTQSFLEPPECNFGGPEPPPRSQTSMWLRCTLNPGCHCLPYHAGQCELKVIP